MALLLYVGRMISESMPEDEPRDFLGMTKAVAVAVAVVAVVFGVPAAYLSWSCNSLLEWTAPAKALFSAFAFVFGLEYILAFVVLKGDLVSELRRLKNGNMGWFFK